MGVWSELQGFSFCDVGCDYIRYFLFVFNYYYISIIVFFIHRLKRKEAICKQYRR